MSAARTGLSSLHSTDPSARALTSGAGAAGAGMGQERGVETSGLTKDALINRILALQDGASPSELSSPEWYALKLDPLDLRFCEGHAMLSGAIIAAADVLVVRHKRLNRDAAPRSGLNSVK